MKEFWLTFLLITTLCLSSCNFEFAGQETTTERKSSDLSHSQNFYDSSVSATTLNDFGGADITPRKYRTRYYSVAYQFVELVGVDNYEDDPYKIIVNPDCAAMNYRKPLWYGDDIKESKKP